MHNTPFCSDTNNFKNKITKETIRTKRKTNFKQIKTPKIYKNYPFTSKVFTHMYIYARTLHCLTSVQFASTHKKCLSVVFF